MQSCLNGHCIRNWQPEMKETFNVPVWSSSTEFCTYKSFGFILVRHGRFERFSRRKPR